MIILSKVNSMVYGGAEPADVHRSYLTDIYHVET